MELQYDIRQALLAVIDCVLRDVLGWLERYESILHHPEKWQERDAYLMLAIQADEELDVLHRLLQEKDYAQEGGMLLPRSHIRVGV